VGKHEVGYERADKDFYPTPRWPTEALVGRIPVAGRRVWEPAVGRGDMAKVLEAAGAEVYATDIEDRGYAKLDLVHDFLAPPPAGLQFDAIITNPPFGPRAALATKFIEIGLERIGDSGLVAMLLPIDFDSAKSRQHLFGGCPEFAAKIVLTRRIVWFESDHASPKENHAWYVWRRPARARAPIIRYAHIDSSHPELHAAARPAAEGRADPLPGVSPDSHVASERT
jgi:hypothetical protein